MKLSFKESGLAYLWLALLFLVLDQISKQWVTQTFNLYESINVFPFFNLTYVHNPGAAFSFLADQPGWQRWFLTAVATIACIIFSVWMSRTPKENKVLSCGLALMLSGAMGNLIDRALFGYVIDFLDFYHDVFTIVLSTPHWPAFNIADSAIFVGAGLMIFDSFKSDNKEVK